MKFLGLNVLDFHLRNERYKETCKKIFFLMIKAKQKTKKETPHNNNRKRIAPHIPKAE